MLVKHAPDFWGDRKKGAFVEPSQLAGNGLVSLPPKNVLLS
jgi:hypothetical protein